MSKSKRRIANEIPTATEVAAAPPPTTKIAMVVGLLSRPEGASLDMLVRSTGWQTHSVRGAMAGAIKKKLGLTVTSEKIDGVRIYRIGQELAA